MHPTLAERSLRSLYSLALYLLLPLTVYHLVWRGFRQPGYLLRWSERYAMYSGDPRIVDIWLHAVSVGEVNAVAPLVQALRDAHPALRILVTTITPTGSERVTKLWGDDVVHVYLPYDLPGAVHRFLRHFRPRLGLIVETELWPNLLFGCRDLRIPSYVVNGRLSKQSSGSYRWLQPLLRHALRTVRHVGAQSDADAARFIAVGADAHAVSVTGNLKYDIAVEPGIDEFVAGFRQRAGMRPVWVAASTHPDEDAVVIDMHRALLAKWPDALLLWAPRHPERFRSAIQQSIDAGWRVATRRLTSLPAQEDQVFVIDTLGELVRFYACAQVAFVGGSLQPIGGHNLLEPASMGCAVVTGPHLHNFSEIAKLLRDADALRIGADARTVGEHVAALLEDDDARARMAEAGRALVMRGRGAVQRTLEMIAPDMPSAQ